jgi:predicted RNase H-like HicB family nuclease
MIKTPKHFRVIIEQDEDGLFTATVPALPGCYTQAKTMPVLKERIKDVIVLCCDVLKHDKDYKKRVMNFAYEPSFVGLETVTI